MSGGGETLLAGLSAIENGDAATASVGADAAETETAQSGKAKVPKDVGQESECESDDESATAVFPC